jgi:hypothetical protein
VPSERSFDDNALYSFSAPQEGDPWFMLRALRNASGNSASKTFTLPDYLAGQGETITLNYWGGLDYAGETPDHSVQFALNGTVIASDRFDGLNARTRKLNLPAGVLRAGSNTLTLTLIGDTGFASDIVNLESFTLGYRRALVANGGELDVRLSGNLSDAFFSNGFELAGAERSGSEQSFSIAGISTPSVILLKSADRLTLLAETSGAVTVRAKVEAGDRLIVEPKRSMALRASVAASDPITGQASYWIISHPSFIEGLGSFVAAKQAQGFSVKVVDVEAIYRHYSGGEVQPAAIQSALRKAQSQGASHVLLVGGDSYDYHNVLGINSVSFVPTHYRRTSEIVRFAPTDMPYADTDQNGVPDLALGRWPVRTLAELNHLIAKTLAYQNARKALFLSDRALSGESYAEASAGMQSVLASGWNASAITLDSYNPGSAAQARADMVNALHQGVSLLSYYGHSAPASWSREGLLTANLVNQGLFNSVPQSFTTLQLGCWGTYFVEPTSTTVAHGLLLNPRGAAAVIGATALTKSRSDIRFANELLPRLDSMELGVALKLSQAALGTGSEEIDVVQGGVLLGDPSLR